MQLLRCSGCFNGGMWLLGLVLSQILLVQGNILTFRKLLAALQQFLKILGVICWVMSVFKVSVCNFCLSSTISV